MWIAGLPPVGARLKQWSLAVLAAGAVTLTGTAPETAVGFTPPASLGIVALEQLPREAQATERLVRDGGPFPYSKDGTVFGNRERLLPSKRRGYYREYTVKTPGVRHRGARRLVCGGEMPRVPEACFYTDDHYASFRRIVP